MINTAKVTSLQQKKKAITSLFNAYSKETQAILTLTHAEKQVIHSTPAK
jgi:hypothetical protein